MAILDKKRRRGMITFCQLKNDEIDCWGAK
jgi:hypothetical protein